MAAAGSAGDGADGTRGANGANGSCAANSPDGKDGQPGVGGGSGTDGGNGGDAVAVLDGGDDVTVSYSAVVGAAAYAGAAGLGGSAASAGTVATAATASRAAPAACSASCGRSPAMPATAGRARATAASARRAAAAPPWPRSTCAPASGSSTPRSRMPRRWCPTTSCRPPASSSSSAATVQPRDPHRLGGPEDTSRVNNVGVGGVGGVAANGTTTGTAGANGTPDRTIFDRDDASARGGAFGFGPDTTDFAEVSYSTIADVALQAPTTANRRPGPSFRYLTLATGGALANNEAVGFRGSVLWNPAAAGATCPNMGSRGANVHDGRCLGGRSGDLIVADRPVAAEPKAVGAVIRPGPMPGETPVRMMTLPLASTSPAVDFTARAQPPACQPVDTFDPSFADDARREARDLRCDAGSFEYTGDPGLALEMPPFFYADDVFGGEVVNVLLPTNPGTSTLTVSVLGSNGQTFDQPVEVAFDSPLVATTPLFGAEATAALDLPDDAFPLRIPLRVTPRGGTSSVAVSAKIEGAAVPLDVTETRQRAGGRPDLRLRRLAARGEHLPALRAHHVPGLVHRPVPGPQRAGGVVARHAPGRRVGARAHGLAPG